MEVVLEPQLQTGSGERFARVGDIELCYETFGDLDSPPVLLVMGLGGQMLLWDEHFCQTLADRGYFVVRFDNRDIGRSTILREARVPTRTQLFLRDRRGAAYALDDMAGDAARLIRELEIGPAHVVGVSMGGMIAQLLAIHHPRQVQSLVSIMSTTGNRAVGQAHPRLWPRMLRRPRRDREGYIRDFVEGYEAIGSTRYPPDPERMRRRGAQCFDRGVHRSGAARQLAAVVTAYDRTPLLSELSLPTTVIHGSADPLVQPSGGRATADAIPGARLVVLDGMGHDLPPQLWPQIVDAIEENAERAG
jgi:pimeloyl-ACP methyl ester carboxylesterase